AMPGQSSATKSVRARNVARIIQRLLFSGRSASAAQRPPELSSPVCPETTDRRKAIPERGMVCPFWKRYASFGNIGQDSSCPPGNNRKRLQEARRAFCGGDAGGRAGGNPLMGDAGSAELVAGAVGTAGRSDQGDAVAVGDRPASAARAGVGGDVRGAGSD